MSELRRDVVAVGASAGGVEALQTLVAGLPRDFPAALLVVMHLPAGASSALPQILDRTGPLPAIPAVHGAELQPGTIQVAMPDRHLLLSHGRVLLGKGPTENGHRPAINSTFRSATSSWSRCSPRAGRPSW
jgi:two-component system chemotaxis response regulator CheB